MKFDAPVELWKVPILRVTKKLMKIRSVTYIATTPPLPALGIQIPPTPRVTLAGRSVALDSPAAGRIQKPSEPWKGNASMNPNQNSVSFLNAKPAKFSCDPTRIKQRWPGPGSFLPARLWRWACWLSIQLITAALTADIASATSLVNGGNQAGTILTNTTDSYTLTANTGDNIVLRLGTFGFDGNLNLYGPGGALLKNAASGTDAELD